MMHKINILRKNQNPNDRFLGDPSRSPHRLYNTEEVARCTIIWQRISKRLIPIIGSECHPSLIQYCSTSVLQMVVEDNSRFRTQAHQEREERKRPSLPTRMATILNIMSTPFPYQLHCRSRTPRPYHS